MGFEPKSIWQQYPKSSTCQVGEGLSWVWVSLRVTPGALGTVTAQLTPLVAGWEPDVLQAPCLPMLGRSCQSHHLGFSKGVCAFCELLSLTETWIHRGFPLLTCRDLVSI